MKIGRRFIIVETSIILGSVFLIVTTCEQKVVDYLLSLDID